MKPFRYFFASCLLWVSSLADAEIYHGPASVAARSRSDWSRFLDQATFGPRSVEIDAWAMRDLAAWIAGQGLIEPTLFPFLPIYPSSTAQGCPGTGTDYSNCVRDNYSMYPLQVQFFKNALGAEDQLRQRVAYALSQVLVVSGVKIRQPSSMVPYLNLLVQGALGNFRDLLESITLNPAMGQYLDMVNSDPATSNGVVKPNENYAREVLQLFSVGINRLNPDGSLARDAAGLPIPNYTQETIEAFARAFTGWTYASLTGAKPLRHNPQNFQSPMEVYRVNGKDQNHDHSAKHLLDYPGAISRDLPPNQDAQLDMKGALDNIFNHPNVGPFIGKQLIQHLVPVTRVLPTCSGLRPYSTTMDKAFGAIFLQQLPRSFWTRRLEISPHGISVNTVNRFFLSRPCFVRFMPVLTGYSIQEPRPWVRMSFAPLPFFQTILTNTRYRGPNFRGLNLALPHPQH